MEEKRRIVIVDDEKLSLDGMNNIVSKIDGTAVSAFSDALSAFEFISENETDLLLTDIRMPGHDGLWLINQVEQLKYNTAIIIVSAYDDKQYLFKAIKSPLVFDYITKPFLKDEFVELVNMALNYQKNRMGYNGLNVNSLISAIINSDDKQAEELIVSYFSKEDKDINKLKNSIYGTLMAISNTFYSAGSGESVMQTMQKVYELNDKEEIMNELILFIKYCISNNDKASSVTTIVAGCLKIINSEISNPDLNLNMVAEMLSVTPNYLSNRFSRDMKQSFSNYISTLRIKKAKDLLKQLNIKVYEVAEKTGYSDAAYFNKVFKEFTGMTPLQYRNEKINQAE